VPLRGFFKWNDRPNPIGRRLRLNASAVNLRTTLIHAAHSVHYTLSLSFTSAGMAGGRVPTEFGVGDANANCPPRFCHVSKFHTPDCMHYNAVMQLKAHQPIILTQYSLFPKCTFSSSTKSLLQAEHSTFFSGKNTDKSTAQNAPKYAISSEKFLPPHTLTLATTKPSGCTLRPPEFQPHLRHCLHGWLSAWNHPACFVRILNAPANTQFRTYSRKFYCSFHSYFANFSYVTPARYIKPLGQWVSK